MIDGLDLKVLLEADGDDRFDLAGMLVRNIYFESETRIN